MIRKQKNNQKKFEEFYFDGYYKGIGDFSNTRDKELANWFRAIFHYLNKYAPLLRGNKRKIIEFGSATGAAAGELQGYGFVVTATDVSKLAVDRAKKNYPGIKFYVHDIQELFTKDKNYDIALALDVIEHLEDPEAAIRNIKKILKIGGVAVFSTPNDYKHVYGDPTHISVKKPEEWYKIFKKIGFKKIVITQKTFIPFFYRKHWRLNLALPFAISFKYFISPVFIIVWK